MSHFFILKPYVKPALSQSVRRSEKCALSLAHGSILAQDILAQSDIPPYDMALRDGWAISTKVSTPREIDPQGVMNGTCSKPLLPHQARWINTGGMIPFGCDAVVPARSKEEVDIILTQTIEPEQFILRQGADRYCGEVILPKGTRLGAREIALLCEANIVDVPIYKAPRVRILSTGSEISAERSHSLGCRRASNATYVRALLETLGVDSEIRTVPDDLEALVSAMSDRASVDFIVSIGGTGRGTHDLMRQAIVQAGGELEDLSSAEHSAPPFIWARLGSIPLIGLPGHPLGALMISQRVLLPILMEVFALKRPMLKALPAILTTDVEVDSPGDLCVSLSKKNGLWLAEPICKGTCTTSIFAVDAGVVKVQPGARSAGSSVMVEPFFN